jgi:multiple sugar transport system permease protein
MNPTEAKIPLSALLPHALGTALMWIGIACGLKVAARLSQVIAKHPDIHPDRTKRDLWMNALFALLGIAGGFILTSPLTKDGFKLPLTWFVMPWTAWIGVGAIIFCVFKGIAAVTSISKEESGAQWSAFSFSAALAAIMAILHFRGDAEIKILRGGIPMSIPIALGLLVLSILAVQLMALTANSAKAKGLGKILMTQLALIAGSIVFGIPFAFLLLTSFKEDIDMASKDGKIVWIPKVTETVDYLSEDPSKKHYEAQFNGRLVEALIIDNKDGKFQMDIFKPMSMRGVTFLAAPNEIKEVPIQAKVYTATVEGKEIKGFERESLEDGRKILRVLTPNDLRGKEFTVLSEQAKPVRHVGLRTQNYTEALDYMPPETLTGLVYLRNTLILVILGVVGTITGSSLVAYGFSRLKFPGKEKLFTILLSTMMLPGAVTLLPQFLIFRYLGWIDTLYPLWVPAFCGSAFNIFLLRQFFSQIPMELEDAAKIDGCNYFNTFLKIMIPQIKPALAVIAIWTFLGAWNNFMGPLIYINSPENMPLSYALQLFKGDRSNEPGLLMAFTSLTCVPVVALFFAAQKYFIEGVTLSGLGGR